MQSFLIKFDGDLARLKKIEWIPAALPFQIAQKGSAVIIGSAGGHEVLCALSHGFQDIVAIEMDPVICELLERDYAEYTGRIFQLPQVKLLADEGRSALKRMDRQFDVIQMVNSHNADSLLSGAISISETYIYTVESFKDYWAHLRPGGLIYIVHWNGERLFATALQALREMGVERPEEKTVRGSAVNIAPVYDGSPYFNQPNRIGQFRFRDVKIQGMGRQVVRSALVYSNSIYLSILALSLLFSLLFIYLPLRGRRVAASLAPLILYFFFIGLAYIMVEIIFIKIFQFFLGSPAISISIIIFSMLVSSGFGSLLGERLFRPLGRRMIPLLAAFLALLLALYGAFLFRGLGSLIQLGSAWRALIAFALIALAGFFMGAFFPEGIRRLGAADKAMIGWGLDHGGDRLHQLELHRRAAAGGPLLPGRGLVLRPGGEGGSGLR